MLRTQSLKATLAQKGRCRRAFWNRARPGWTPDRLVAGARFGTCLLSLPRSGKRVSASPFPSSAAGRSAA